MSTDHTQQQTEHSRLRSVELSLKKTTPPSTVPGYDILEFLGDGAYGEVWVGVDGKTKRRVAIKFFTKRGSVDFGLLAGEVEKLVFLSTDRYVVQLLDVGLESDPPYFVMDYIENGSLEDELERRGSYTVAEALDLFQEMATGLSHLHNRGILHCDLKPGNVLLDQDHKPRLADFGQSRLVHEQAPALGTLFYMAPEQADLDAIPDARWDVYALGAVVYTMLTGNAPYRNSERIKQIESGDDIADRLARYRSSIHNAERPSLHRQCPGMDRAFAEIIDRCLAPEPMDRFESVQSAMIALKQREENRARRPIMILGLVGPLILLTIMMLFGIGVYNQAIGESEQGIRQKAKESNGWAAQFAARSAGAQIETYFDAVERLSIDPRLSSALEQLEASDEATSLLRVLDNPSQNGRLPDDRRRFEQLSERMPLQLLLESMLDDPNLPRAASWFVCDDRGTQLAAAFAEPNVNPTIGKNYAFRTYFQGEDEDGIRIGPDGRVSYHVEETDGIRAHIVRSHLSAIFTSQATDRWKVAFSVPIWIDGQFKGIVAATVDMGGFIEFDHRRAQFAMLVDGRAGPNQGVILEHPLFDQIRASGRPLPRRFADYRVDLDAIDPLSQVYQDPLAGDNEGQSFRGDWIAAKRPVTRRVSRDQPNGTPTRVETGLFVIALEDARMVVEPTHVLGEKMVNLGIWAMTIVILVSLGMWYLVVRTLQESRARVRRAFSSTADATSIYSARTMSAPGQSTEG